MSTSPQNLESPSPEPVQRSHSFWKPLVALAVLAGGAYLAYSTLSAPAEKETAAQMVIRTAPVTAGAVEQVIRLGGVTSSIVFTNVTAPRMRGGERRPMILLEMLPSGARVKKGDIVARIDGQGLRDHIDDVNATRIASLADIKKRRAEQEVDWSNLEQNLRLAKSNLDKWKLEEQAAEIRTVIDRELLRLGVEESQSAYAEQEKDLPLDKAVYGAELKILEITSERHKRHMDRHLYDLRRYTVVASMDGMVVRQQIFRNGEFGMVEVGDALWPGRLFVKIMDTDNMQVEATMNQVESSLFKIGMKARIGLDAFPGVQLRGRIYSIGALAKSSRQSQWVRTIPVRIKIEGADPRLIPDLSAHADVSIGGVEDVTRVPLGAVTTEAGQAYVYVKAGQRFEKRPVVLGMKNFLYAQVVSGLEPGEEVALDHPVS